MVELLTLHQARVLGVTGLAQRTGLSTERVSSDGVSSFIKGGAHANNAALADGESTDVFVPVHHGSEAKVNARSVESAPQVVMVEPVRTAPMTPAAKRAALKAYLSSLGTSGLALRLGIKEDEILRIGMSGVFTRYADQLGLTALN